MSCVGFYFLEKKEKGNLAVRVLGEATKTEICLIFVPLACIPLRGGLRRHLHACFSSNSCFHISARKYSGKRNQSSLSLAMTPTANTEKKNWWGVSPFMHDCYYFYVQFRFSISLMDGKRSTLSPKNPFHLFLFRTLASLFVRPSDFRVFPK